MAWDHKQSVKEVIRHYGHTLGFTPILNAHRRQRGFVTDHLNGKRSDRFAAIYRLGAWIHSSGQVSLSGVGSEAEATAKLGVALPQMLERLSCRRLLDVGCGDWNWMKNTPLPCEYVGVDIVADVIEANRRRYAKPGVSFAVADAVVDPLPTADVALCREVLFHLSFDDAVACLANIRRSAPWLIATSDTLIWFNSDVATGDFRRINLQRSPYRLPPPREIIADNTVSPGRILGLWATSECMETS